MLLAASLATSFLAGACSSDRLEKIETPTKVPSDQTALEAAGGASQDNARAAKVVLEISPKKATRAAGATQQFKLTAIVDGNSKRDVTADAEWSAADPTVADFSLATQGLADARAPGETAVTA